MKNYEIKIKMFLLNDDFTIRGRTRLKSSLWTSTVGEISFRHILNVRKTLKILKAKLNWISNDVIKSMPKKSYFLLINFVSALVKIFIFAVLMPEPGSSQNS